MSNSISLIKYEFADEGEEIVAKTLTYLQRKAMENLLVDTIMEKMTLTPTSSDPQVFLLQHEFLRGQITNLQYILALDENGNSAQTVVPSF